MTLTIRDILYIMGYIVTIISIYFYVKNRIYNISKDLSKTEKIIFGERGYLNLIDMQTCEKNRNHVFAAIRRSDEVMGEAVKKLNQLNDNVNRILVIIEMREVDIKKNNIDKQKN